MKDAYCKFVAFTGFITKDDRKGTVVEAALKRDKDEGNDKKKWRKKEGMRLK